MAVKIQKIDVEVKNVGPIGENSSILQDIIALQKPIIFRGLDLGPCTAVWKDINYLKSHVPEQKTVSTHVSTDFRLNFLKKNFKFETYRFHELLDKCFNNVEYKNDDVQINSPRFYYYLRALSENPRAAVANFRADFPSLCEKRDVRIPPLFAPFDEKHFSSVLRVSSAGVQLWTHYDIFDNALMQIVGRKYVVLFNPLDVPYLYLEGDKSKVMDIDAPDLDTFPLFAKATQYVCTLEPGDVLYIPALWFHNTKALTAGLALNIFWKNLHNPSLYYDPKDLYGNKDLLPAQRTFQTLDKCTNALAELPEPYAKFYALRLIENIKRKFNL